MHYKGNFNDKPNNATFKIRLETAAHSVWFNVSNSGYGTVTISSDVDTAIVKGNSGRVNLALIEDALSRKSDAAASNGEQALAG